MRSHGTLSLFKEREKLLKERYLGEAVLNAVHTIKLKVGIRKRDTTRRAKDIYAQTRASVPTPQARAGCPRDSSKAARRLSGPLSRSHMIPPTTIYLLERTIVTGDLVGPHWMAVPRRQGPWPGRGHESTTEA